MPQLDGEHHLDNGGVMTMREWAAGILHEVADDGFVGTFPDNITAFDLGRALNRIAVNSGAKMEEFYYELTRGWDHTEANRTRR